MFTTLTYIVDNEIFRTEYYHELNESLLSFSVRVIYIYGLSSERTDYHYNMVYEVVYKIHPPFCIYF
jgi:hypothetical protein